MNISSQYENMGFNRKKRGNSIKPEGNLLSRSSILKSRSPIKNEIPSSPVKSSPTSIPQPPEVDTLYVAEDYFNEGYA